MKGRFLEALENKLFGTHQSFLQSLLLTIIMLLTFEEYGEIPNKMHAFYARAFDTLFQNHDADKDQFVRKIRSGLSRDEFKLVLAGFCAFSYADETFTFTRSKFDHYIDSAIKYSKFVNPSMIIRSPDFIADLRDAVCLIQEDGLNFVFVHRSFQEYFTAVFVNKLQSDKIKSIIDKLAGRFSDNVVPMALDMAREKIEVEWVLPTIRRYIEVFAPRGAGEIVLRS